ncbi:MAG: hypothetical protein J0I06_25935 [Planctomycetes bacterium]|nr:hypothetical protein [Planctomycetota bacterium]
MNYVELVAALPLPTPEQTAAFARHVADNHSWYKHLPFFPPGATFVFFLNPHAGEGVERVGDRFVTRPLEEGDYFRHHSRFTTALYLKRFGHWDYWVNNPRALRPAEGPFLYGVGTDADGREPLPDDLKRRWSCGLTAFLKLSPAVGSETFHSEREAFEEYARQNPADLNVERYLELARGGDSFATTEIHVQRQLVLQTLMAVRDDCARLRSAP